MKPDLRDRLLMPVLLPIAIVVLLAGALFGFSRILLSLTATTATITAIVVATGVLVTSSVAATRKQIRLSTIGAVVGVTAGLAMLAGGIALAVVGGTEEGERPGPSRPVVALAARDIAFEPTMLQVPAGTAFTLRFDNQDANVQHNVQIFDNPDHAGTPLFFGELVTGVQRMDYVVDALEEGTYFFQCVVHPNMTGEMHAQPGPPGGPGGGGITVVAQGTAFDTSRIELPPGMPTTITFENRDAGTQHNIAIYTNSSLEQELFNGELITGPGTVTYRIPPLEPGEYYFHCIVHPPMNGTVVVGGPADGGGPPPEPTGST
jgi:plastocyanin